MSYSYYISPSGSDSNSGSLSSPWASLNRAWTQVSAGDTIYLRGGTYTLTSQQFLSGVNGQAGNMINIWAYANETPVLTRGSSFSHSSATNVGIYLNADYTYWKGIEIYNFYQEDSGVWGGMWLQDSSHNKFELINYHHCGFPFSIGMGFADISTDNYVLNCDFHHNYDPLSDYDDADGAEVFTAYGTENTFEGCRFWSNSDDGIDQLQSDGRLIINRCWAWNNGYREDGATKGGNGHGFKLGEGTSAHYSEHMTTITNSLAFHNRQGGISMGTSTSICWCFNNTAYHNADGDVYNLGFEFDNDHVTHILRNNIAHANQHPSDLQANYGGCTEDHNSWDSYSVSDGDFVSLNMGGVDDERQPDGSLPLLTFLHLAEGSDLIGTGIDVGLDTDGDGNEWNSTPSLGAFEYGGTPPEPALSGDTSISFTIGAETIAGQPKKSLAPDGWHLPTKEDFEELATYLGITAGGKLKETGTVHWDSPNEGATNETGFAVRGSGMRYDDGTFANLKASSRLWSSTIYSEFHEGMFNVYDYLMRYDQSTLTEDHISSVNGCPVRLIKDDSTDPETMTDYDGNIYRTVKIGNQVWMASNLKVTHYNDGTPIPEVTDGIEWSGLTTGAMCAFNNDWSNV
jgi:uncharacterized protein (TIGR02145 family)